MTGDLADFLQVNAFARATGWLHPLATAYATYGVALFGALLVAAWWLARRRSALVMARALLAPVAVLVAVAVNQPIVHGVNEPRPFTRVPSALVLVHRSADASFPSDHATMAGAVAVAVLLVSLRLGAVAVVAALVMAADRVYVGAHYPLDVVAGLAVGAAVSAAILLALAPHVARAVGWLSATRLGPAVSAGRTGPSAQVPAASSGRCPVVARPAQRLRRSR